MATEQERIEQLRKMQHRPSTPGDVLADIIDEIGMTQSELARRLGVSRHIVSELLKGKRAVTPDMAHRLGRLMGNGPNLWLNLQKQVDLWDALHMDQSQYEHIEPLPRAEAA